MKKLLIIILLAITLLCMLASCGDDEPIIEVNADGYVVVNGVITNIVADKNDVISVDTDGYVIVNGVKTEYEIKNKNHSFSEWELYNEDETDCEKKLYYRVCSDCSSIEWKEGKYEDHDFVIVTTEPTCQMGGYDTLCCTICEKNVLTNQTPPTHDYKTNYIINDSQHWLECSICGTDKDRSEHTLDDEAICTICKMPIESTPGIIYDISGDGTYVDVIGYEGTATKIKIPEVHQGLPVKNIYDNAFKNKNISDVVLPNSIISIGASAFAGCPITHITLPQNITSIGNQAFSSSLLKAIVIPDSVSIISGGAFYGCKNLSEVKIGNNVTTIGNGAFENCYSLKSIVIPEKVNEISNSAFKNCSSLESVIIGNGVTTINRYAFENCTSINSIQMGENVKRIGNSAFAGCEKVLSEDNNCKYLISNNNSHYVLIGTINRNLSTYDINENTRIIAEDAFSFCSRLSYITIPDGIQVINWSTFYKCPELQSVIIPQSVQTVDYCAFYGCDKLSNVYYKGTQNEWERISIDNSYSSNAPLVGAKKHYNYISEE